MPRTAREKGLRKNSLLDERYSLEHATAAALTYLRECHDEFGSWSLAMAAYNCGERRVQQAIAAQKTNDYYQLKLPAETERYVYRIAAIKILLENYAQYGYRIEPEELYPPAAYDTLELNSPYELKIADIAKAAGTDFKTIRDLNPQLKDYYFPTGKYTIKVPAGLGEKFSSEVARSLADAAKRARSQKAYYIVKRGDTLGHIAQRTGVPIEKIKTLNNLRGSTIYPGQKLRLRP
jgi:LysM repeat protein